MALPTHNTVKVSPYAAKDLECATNADKIPQKPAVAEGKDRCNRHSSKPPPLLPTQTW